MTRELLSEVYSGHIVLKFSIKNPYEILIEFDGFEEIVNIYELANMCKEWAYKLNYGLESKYSTSDGGRWVCLINEYNIKYHSAKHADTEPEAIFQATQYILDNLKKDEEDV